MKFLALLATACAVFSSVAQAQNATLVPCVPLNITAKKADIAALNGVIDVAIKSGLLKSNLVTLDPLVIVENRLSPIPFSVLGTDFALTPIIKKLNATGIATVVPKHLNITDDTTLAIGAIFNGTIDVDATVDFEIAQLNKQWWHICWTNALQPVQCPPATIQVDIGVGLFKPTVGVNASIGMLMCPKGLPRGTCTDVTVSNILIAALTNKLPALFERILKKFTSAEIKDLAVDFDQLTKLSFNFPKSGPLLTALFEKLLGYTADEVNKKEQLYEDIIAVVNVLGKKLLNQLITEQLVPKFGNTCY